MDWKSVVSALPIAVAALGALSGVLTALGSLWWGRTALDAKDAQIQARDAQLKVRDDRIQFLEDLQVPNMLEHVRNIKSWYEHQIEFVRTKAEWDQERREQRIRELEDRMAEVTVAEVGLTVTRHITATGRPGSKATGSVKYRKADGKPDYVTSSGVVIHLDDPSVSTDLRERVLAVYRDLALLAGEQEATSPSTIPQFERPAAPRLNLNAAPHTEEKRAAAPLPATSRLSDGEPTPIDPFVSLARISEERLAAEAHARPVPAPRPDGRD